MTAEKTQPTFARNAENLASDSEGKQNRRLMIASTISVAVNVLFLIGAAQGMEDKSSPDKLNKPDRFVTGIFTISPEVSPTPAPSPEPKKIARVEPRETEPEVRRTLPSIVPVKPNPVPVEETKPISVVVPTPPTPPEVTEIPDAEPVTPPVKPVAEMADATAVEAPASVQARAVRVMETTASNRTTDASVAMNAASAVPMQRGDVASEHSINIAAPSAANSSISLATGTRAFRASVAEEVTGGSTSVMEDKISSPVGMGRQSNASPAQRTGGDFGANDSALSHNIGGPRGANRESNPSGMIAGPTLNLPSGPALGVRANIAMQAEAVASAGESGGVGVKVAGSGKGASGSGAPRLTNSGGTFGSGVGTAKVRNGTPGSSGGEGSMNRVGVRPGSGGGNGGPAVSRDSGIRAGSGSGTEIKAGDGKGREADVKGTNTAESVGRAEIPIAASGGGGADIVTSKTRFIDGGNEMIQVSGGADPNTARPVSAPRTERLSEKIDSNNIQSIVGAKVLTRKQPAITDEMKATNPQKVTVEFTIGANGSASYRIVGSSGNAEVDAAVLKACAGYRWRAGSKGGVPVASSQRVTFDPNE